MDNLTTAFSIGAPVILVCALSCLWTSMRAAHADARGFGNIDLPDAAPTRPDRHALADAFPIVRPNAARQMRQSPRKDAVREFITQPLTSSKNK
jgi:hypothetical protein